LSKVKHNWRYIQFSSTQELNLEDFEMVKDYLKKHKPDLIINCAATTNVDECEKKAISTINTILLLILSSWSRDNNSKIIHISSASVFGTYGALSPEINFVQKEPLNRYAEQKLSAEKLVQALAENYKIIRSAWLFGNNTGKKKFIGQIYEKLKNGETIKAVTDIEGQLLLASDMAKFIRVVIDKWNRIPQILHAGSYDTASRFQIAQYIEHKISAMKNELCSYRHVEPCLNREFDLPAMRPHK
jgi:dTDP-4-dehydrorhamnose reductase